MTTPEPTSEANGRQPAVGVIDGDDGVRRSLESLLKTLDVSVVTFSSAEEFLEYIDRRPFDCLVTEVELPGMSGIELQCRLRERAIRLPVIVIATEADVAMAVRAMRPGALDFIEKPFVERAVLARVRQALASGR